MLQPAGAGRNYQGNVQEEDGENSGRCESRMGWSKMVFRTPKTLEPDLEPELQIRLGLDRLVSARDVRVSVSPDRQSSRPDQGWIAGSFGSWGPCVRRLNYENVVGSIENGWGTRFFHLPVQCCRAVWLLCDCFTARTS